MNSADTSRYRTAGDGIEEGAESAVDPVGKGAACQPVQFFRSLLGRHDIKWIQMPAAAGG